MDASIQAHVDELRALGRIEQAVAVCVSAGDHARASSLLEEACDFAGAARHAQKADDLPRAARLAALSGHHDLTAEIHAALVGGAPREVGLRVAGDLAARGFHRQGGDLYAALSEPLAAARAFVEGGDPVRAAACFEAAGRPPDGAKALEAALRMCPGDAAARLALGRLLARHGRTEGAIKALQQLDAEAPERRQALPLLARCLVELGLEDAARAVREEIARLGISERPPSAAPPPRASTAGGALLFGRYEVVREVATTPNARVMEAVDRLTSERVAVKVLAAGSEGAGRDALVRFEREARALGELRHPNAVPLHAYLPDGPALVLAWMAGGSLADLMRREPLSPGRAVEIACAVLDALGEAHRLGILHRDVKPSNVLFDAVGSARLGDFGAAHLGDLSSTATAGAIGTFAYMSPEQRLGRPATVQSDLYAVGAMLYEILTGQPAEPARGGRLDPPPSALHPDLGNPHDTLVARLLAEDPALRPEDAFSARRALSSVAWSARVPEWLPTSSARGRTSDRPPASQNVRVGPPREESDGRDVFLRRHDGWLARDVLVLPVDEATLACARAFARCGHPALPAILRVDSTAAEIWVAPPRGRCLADEARALTAGPLARLREAVVALHEAGGAHGAIDRKHLYWHDGELVLAYPRCPVDDASARDEAALAALGA